MSESTSWMLSIAEIYPPTMGYPGVESYYEQCGETGRYCISGLTGMSNTCGTWLTQSGMCCYAEIESTDLSEIVVVPCGTIPGITDTPYNKIGVPEFTVPSDTCPNDSYSTFSDPSNDETSVCCDKSYKSMVILNKPDPAYPEDYQAFQYETPLRCVNLRISPSEEDIAEARRIVYASMATLTESQTPFGQVPEETAASTSTSTSNGGSTGVSSAGGAAKTSSAGLGKKVSFLVVGSAFVAVLLGMQL
ncbi:hypothetical protein TWF694_004696 [Orbilia ellipsospora]|uniref:Uncharacterized protein n=1 Tax=Orbilia ellipsospora TaxID=2528407 RepID=A0AAV9WVX7_9PEZI